jgi:hypothetical protein
MISSRTASKLTVNSFVNAKLVEKKRPWINL